MADSPKKGMEALKDPKYLSSFIVVIATVIILVKCSFGGSEEYSEDMTDQEMYDYQQEIDENSKTNGTEKLLDDTKREKDSIALIIGYEAARKFPNDIPKMNSEIQDQEIAYDYMKSMPDDEYKSKAQAKFPKDYVKQKDEYNKHF